MLTLQAGSTHGLIGSSIISRFVPPPLGCPTMHVWEHHAFCCNMPYGAENTSGFTSLAFVQHNGKVHMVMYYRDMMFVRTVKSRLLFKIRTSLNMFTAHYDPLKPEDLLSITFDSQKPLQRFHSILKQAVR